MSRYVIAQPSGCKSPQLLRIIKQKGGLYSGVVPDHTSVGDPNVMDFVSSDVLLPLPDSPAYGTVYGVLVEPLVKRYLVRGWGEVYHYVKLPESVVQRVNNSFARTMSIFKKWRLDEWHNDIVTHVRNPKGRQLGLYQFRPKDHDSITLRPNVGMSTRELVKVIAHEGAHGVWFRKMTASDRAEWIWLYGQFVSVDSVSVSDCKRMIASMRQMEGLRPYLREAEPEEQAAANIYVGWLKRIHGISGNELTDLVTSGKKIPLPDTYLHKSKVAAPITLYSKESPTELFAEALSAEFVGDLADKRIRKMLSRLRK